MPPSDEPPIALEGPAPPENGGQKRQVRAGAPVKAGAPVAALVPHTIEEAWRLAVAIARSGLAPKDMKRPEQVLVAIMGGAEVGLPPFQAMQSFAVINGRPTMWGDGLLGVVRARGVQVREWMEGEGDAMVAWCRVKRPDTDEEPIERYFSVADAKTAGLWMKKGSQGQDTPWVTYPRRMLQMRARSWAIRDGCADIIRGIQVREEVGDYEMGTVVDDLPAISAPVEEIDDENATIEIVDGDFEEAGATAEAEDATPEPESATEPEQVDARPQRSGIKDTPAGDQ